jgi:hypothetical protein
VYALWWSAIARTVASRCAELLQARRECDEQECAERLLARRMLHLWQQLRAERKDAGFAATRARLQVQLVNEADDLEHDLDDEARPQRAQRAARAFFARRRCAAAVPPLTLAPGRATAAVVQVEERRLLHEKEGRAAADGAVDFDADKMREEVAARQQALRRAPDEQTIVPVYTEDTPPTDLLGVPAGERRRQLEAGQVQLYGVLLVDGRVVGTTKAVSLHPFDFCARVNYSLQLLLMAAPSAISLQIWQRRLAGFADFLIAEVFLAVPEAASPATPKWSHYDFASERTFSAQYRQPPRDDGASDAIHVVPLRCLCGTAAVSVVWAAQPAGRVASAPKHSFRTTHARGAADLTSGALDTTRVRQHVRASDLDPNAPQDVPLLSLLGRREHSSASFRAFRFGKELQLMRNFFSTDRLRLLQLRRERPHEWSALPPKARSVPQRDTEIPIRSARRPHAHRRAPSPCATCVAATCVRLPCVRDRRVRRAMLWHRVVLWCDAVVCCCGSARAARPRRSGCGRRDRRHEPTVEDPCVGTPGARTSAARQDDERVHAHHTRCGTRALP